MLAISFSIAMIVQIIWYSMQDGEIFGFIGNFLQEKLPTKLHNPIFDCPVCMTPWYGTIIYWIIWHNNIKEWIIVVLIAAGINILASKLNKE